MYTLEKSNNILDVLLKKVELLKSANCLSFNALLLKWNQDEPVIHHHITLLIFCFQEWGKVVEIQLWDLPAYLIWTVGLVMGLEHLCVFLLSIQEGKALTALEPSQSLECVCSKQSWGMKLHLFCRQQAWCLLQSSDWMHCACRLSCINLHGAQAHQCAPELCLFFPYEEYSSLLLTQGKIHPGNSLNDELATSAKISDPSQFLTQVISHEC